MESNKSYGQFCPVAMSAELLCKRWTLLVIRELLCGSVGFNEILRGVPLMSRTLLSSRLAELESAGLVRHRGPGSEHRAGYQLTEAGQALLPVVKALGDWGQEWIEPDLAAGNVDFGFLLWNLRRTITRTPDMPKKFIVRFDFVDAPDGKNLFWLVYDGPDFEFCHTDPGGDVDVWIECALATFAELWMGWKPVSVAMREGSFSVEGPARFAENPFRWLGQSNHAGIKKRSPGERVMVG